MTERRKTMYQCCIFDLDGTLLDTLTAISYTCNVTLEAFGYASIERERYKFLAGDGAGKLIERALLEQEGKDVSRYEEVLALYQENFAKDCMYQVKPYDGIPELLEFLKKEGIKITVLSNKPHLRAIDNIETVFGKGYFDHIQGEREDVKRKPDPSGVYQIMNQLGFEQKDCLYLGDTNTDMQTGKNAGLDTVGVTWGFRPEEELLAFHPAYIAHHPSDIQKIIESKKM